MKKLVLIAIIAAAVISGGVGGALAQNPNMVSGRTSDDDAAEDAIIGRMHEDEGVNTALPTCDFSNLVGQQRSSINLTMFGKRPVRFLHRGDSVTLEYSPDRVNIHLDSNDRVAQVTCG